VNLFGSKLELDGGDAYRVALEKDFSLFLQEAVKILNPSWRFKFEMSEHYRVICEWLMYFESGRAQADHPDWVGLNINVPPSTLKSQLMDIFEVWRLIQDGAAKSMHISYGAALAELHSGLRRILVQSKWFRKYWPHIRIREGSNLKTAFDLESGGSLMSNTVKGAVTGFHADLIVLDDILKANDAKSEIIRESVNRWFHESVVSRGQSERMYFVNIQQRLHPMDFVGWIQKNEPDHWVTLSFPLIAEAETTYELPISKSVWVRPKGHVLLSKKFPPHKIDYLKTTEDFDGQYLQRPAPPEGSTFKVANIGVYDPDHPPKFDWLIITVDCGYKVTKRSDFTSVQLWGLYGKQKYLVYKRTERLDVAGTIAAVIYVKQTYPEANLCICEDAANGRAVIEAIQDQGVIQVQAIPPAGGKDSRANAAGSDMAAKEIFFPMPDKTDWPVMAFVELLAQWSGEGSVEFDDDIDAFTQLCAFTRKLTGAGSMASEGSMILDVVTRNQTTQSMAGWKYDASIPSCSSCAGEFGEKINLHFQWAGPGDKDARWKCPQCGRVLQVSGGRENWIAGEKQCSRA
jgi:predicted phage terminase large subunit-like protein